MLAGDNVGRNQSYICYFSYIIHHLFQVLSVFLTLFTFTVFRVSYLITVPFYHDGLVSSQTAGANTSFSSYWKLVMQVACLGGEYFEVLMLENGRVQWRKPRLWSSEFVYKLTTGTGSDKTMWNNVYIWPLALRPKNEYRTRKRGTFIIIAAWVRCRKRKVGNNSLVVCYLPCLYQIYFTLLPVGLYYGISNSVFYYESSFVFFKRQACM